MSVLGSNEFLFEFMFRILGFRRAVPTVGRIVNLTSDLREKAEKRLAKTFFISPGMFFFRQLVIFPCRYCKLRGVNLVDPALFPGYYRL